MAHAHKGKKKVSKAMGEILKAPKKAEKVVKAAEKYVNKTHWDTIEEFSEAVTSSGMIYNRDFIPVNIEALYGAFTSNPEEFKETPAYKFLIQ